MHSQRLRRFRIVIPSLRSELALEPFATAQGKLREGMTILKRLRLTRKTSSLQCIAHKGDPVWAYKYRFLEKKVERKSISSTGERHGSCITIHSNILTIMKPL